MPRRIVATRSVVVETETLMFKVVRTAGRRQVHIVVEPRGIEVRVPYNYPITRAEQHVRDNLDWIRTEAAAAQRAPVVTWGAEIPFLDRSLTIVRGVRARPYVTRLGNRLVVSPRAAGDLPGSLERWFRREARIYFLQRLAALAPAFGGRVPTALAVRGQRTRWGSCSSQGHLSLNWRLLQLAPELVDYVLAHELCHLTHMDHSPAFWALLGRSMRDFEVRRNALAAVGLLPL